ncbi:MAG: hypothetical protein ABR600_08945 [Actinomycetota bacterium]
MRTRRITAGFVSAVLVLGVCAIVTAGSAAAAACTTDNRCGMDLERAWKHFTKGDPHVVISYVEGGINWHTDSAKGLTDRIYVNWRETPVPCTEKAASACGRSYPKHRKAYDGNHDGFVNAADWKSDPRVSDSNENGYVDAEDLIVAFSDGVDRDGNGYPSDISGWDFYDEQNDPATYDSTYGHANGQMGRIHHECPDCSILPVKAGAEALDRTDDLAQAWLYSADAGASVITSTTADLGYSSFMRQAVQYLAGKDIAMVEASNDFDSTDHQGGMWWPNVVPGNSVVLNAAGDGWIRSDYTSWGTHSMFSVTANGGTTSESTPTTSGVIGLLLSWGREAARKHLIKGKLTGPEAIQVLRATARPVRDASLAWPGGPGEWNPQYGYGIPDLYDAMRAVGKGGVPADARIDSPSWYRLFDPTSVGTVKVTGTIDAPRSGGFRWVLQAGVGANPTEKQWFRIGSGHGRRHMHGTLGMLKLSKIPESVWAKPFALSQNKVLETTEQYTVSFRLKVADDDDRLAEDRRSIAVTHDDSWLPGFPLKIRASGESQPALVDLQGTGRRDIVFGDTDGFVHAIDPQSGAELPGWPVHLRPVDVMRSHRGVSPGYEPVVGDVAVGTIDQNGLQLVAVTSLTGRVYLFGPKGELEKGFPILLDKDVQPPPIPRPALRFTRLPAVGSVAGPVLFDLGGSKRLEIIQVGWDGYIHVFESNGTDFPGWPVKVQMPSGYSPPPGLQFVNDQKLETPPAIGYLQGPTQGPDVVLRPQYTETPDEGLQPGGAGYVFAYGADGSLLPGWPARMQGTVEYYGSAQEFVTEGSAAPVTADITGTGVGPDMVAVGPVLSPPYLIDGAGQIQSTYGATPSWPPSAGADIPVAFTTSGAFGKVDGALTFAQAETGSATLATALLQSNSGVDVKEFEGAYAATGGSARPGFPTARQGIDFLGQPIFVDVTGDGGAEIIDGGDSNAIHAWDGTGAMAAGFPKWTTGWTVFSPSAGDLLGTGTTDLVTTTREGYLFAWATPGDASANTEWWRAGHDEWNTGRYGTVTTP